MHKPMTTHFQISQQNALDITWQREKKSCRRNVDHQNIPMIARRQQQFPHIAPDYQKRQASSQRQIEIAPCYQ